MPAPGGPGASKAGGRGGGSGSASAASRLPPPPGRLVWRPLQISVVQSAGLPAVVERGVRGHDHRRADRLEAEFLLAPPADLDRHPRLAQRDDRGVGRGVVGAVMAVAARPLHMLDRDRGRIELQRAGEPGAQRVDALGMGPDLQMAVAIDRHAAGRRDRGMGDVHPRVARLEARGGGRRIGGRRADRLVDRGLLQQPARLLLERVQRLDIVPGDMARRDAGRGLDGGLVGAEDRDEITVADDLDRSLGGTADRRLVDLAIVAPRRGWRTTRACACRRAPGRA